MKVPFRLRRLDSPHPAQALLLLSEDPAELLALLSRWRVQPCIHRVADGFLLRFSQPLEGPCAGVIRLRMPYEQVYVPVDAELVPGLLDDEARGLVREQGLVFLPNGRVLGFQREQPVRLSELIDIGERRRGEWRPLPTAPRLAERIYSITLQRPAEDPDDLLAAGGDDIGVDAPRPRRTGPVGHTVGQAMMGAGQTLFKLGNLLGLKGLAKAGAQWMEKAASWAPRLSESVLGKQEAALRDLLRRFREGKLEDALRHALPIGAEGGRGGFASSGSWLPTHRWRYSLASLLGGNPGRVALWFGGQNVQVELAREYRKAAEEAAHNGDFRRAALIYAKLLADYRAAAQVLLRGGLYHDAAVIFLKKLNDRLAAAQAFESGGEFDSALELYRQLRDYLRTGDLLRKLGDEQAAVAEFRQAAEQYAAHKDYVGAADVMLERAHLPESALEYLATGWRRRPEGSALACALRLAKLHAERGEPQHLLALTAETRAFFDPPGRDIEAEQFYTALARLADHRELAALKDELRDQALVGLAGKLRQRVPTESKPANLVSTFLGRSGLWPAALVHDAQFAVAAALHQQMRTPVASSASLIRMGTGKVTAVAHAPRTGMVFVGFLSGDVAAFRPERSDVIRIKSGDGVAVSALSASANGEALLVLQTGKRSHLSSYSMALDESYVLNLATIDAGQTNYWLPPVTLGGERCCYVAGTDDHFEVRTLHDVRGEPLRPQLAAEKLLTVLVLPASQRTGSPRTVLLLTPQYIHFSFTPAYSESFETKTLGWSPTGPENSPLHSVPLSCLWSEDEFELAGLDREGTIHWMKFLLGRELIVSRGRNVRPCTGGYRAVTLVRPGLVAAVGPSRLEWLRAGRDGFTVQTGTDRAVFTGVVACFASAPTGELLLISRDGTLQRLPLPAGC
jgi:tetratricopeptide (TPR) repeat protein